MSLVYLSNDGKTVRFANKYVNMKMANELFCILKKLNFVILFVFL